MPAGRPRIVDPATRSPQLKHYYASRYEGKKPRKSPTPKPELAARAEKKRQERKTNLEAFLSYRLMQAIGRARHIGVSCTLTPEWLAKQPRVCAVTGQPFVVAAKGKGPLTPSFDRIDPLGPYSPDNTRLVVCWYNMAKLNWPDEQIKQLIIDAAAFIKAGVTV